MNELPDAWVLDEARFGEAYAALDAYERSLLKTCIARLHQIWGESPDLNLSRVARRGFCLEREDRPAATAAIVCPASYRHPAAFLAALMPAVLAGVARILPLFVTDRPGDAVSAPLLAALELAGVEDAYAPDGAAAIEALEALRPERLVLLGDGELGRRFAARAHELDVCFRSFAHPPRYYNERLGRAAIQEFTAEPPAPSRSDGQCRGFAGQSGEHGRAGCPARDAPGRREPCAERKRDVPALSLDAAHEQVWIWPDLDPGWFRKARLRLFRP